MSYIQKKKGNVSGSSKLKMRGSNMTVVKMSSSRNQRKSAGQQRTDDKGNSLSNRMSRKLRPSSRMTVMNKEAKEEAPGTEREEKHIST